MKIKNALNFRFDLKDFENKRELINAMKMTRKLHKDQSYKDTLTKDLLPNNQVEEFTDIYLMYNDSETEDKRVYFRFDVNSSTNRKDIEETAGHIYELGTNPLFIDAFKWDGEWYKVQMENGMILYVYGKQRKANIIKRNI